MNFQHAELIAARDKIEQLNSSMAKSAKEREENLQTARKLLHERRNKSQLKKKQKLLHRDFVVDVEVQKRLLKEDVESGDFDWETLLKCMENQAKNLSSRAENDPTMA